MRLSQFSAHFNGRCPADGYSCPHSTSYHHPLSAWSTVNQIPIQNLSIHNVSNQFVPSPVLFRNQCVSMPIPVPTAQPMPHSNDSSPSSINGGIEVNGLVVYNVAVPPTPRRNPLCILEHDHTSGCLMKSQDVRKWGVLFKDPQETSNKSVTMETAPAKIPQPDAPSVPSQPAPLPLSRSVNAKERLEKEFPFHFDAKAVAAIRKKYPERFECTRNETRTVKKQNVIKQKCSVSTQSQPICILKKKFMSQATRYSARADALQKKLLKDSEKTKQ